MKFKEKSCEKIESRDREYENADVDLENDISLLEISNENKLGLSVSQQKLNVQISQKLDNTEDISIAEEIKNYKEELLEQGKSQIEILTLLISKFENEESVSVWLDNWKNYQKLHNFAGSKPPAERRAIQNIIVNADFTSETAFSTSLAEISQSAEISTETKLEISREFGGSHIDSVDGMGFQLKQVKEHTQALKKNSA